MPSRYVKDLARGLILAGEKGSGDGYALGVAESHSVLEIAERSADRSSSSTGIRARAIRRMTSSKARQSWAGRPTVEVMDYIHAFVR